MFNLFKNIFFSGNNEQLKDAIKAGAILIDVRTAQEFSGGSVPSAINIPFEKLTDFIHQLNPQKEILVFCRTGGRSSMAKNILEQHGFKNVINGGSWQNVNLAIKHLN